MRSYKKDFKVTHKKESFWARLFGDKQFVKSGLAMMIPAMAQSLISIAVIYVDNFSIVSVWHVADEANSAKTALGLAEPLVAFGLMVIVASLGGSGVMMSQYYGNREFNNTQKTVVYRFYTTFIVTIPIILLFALIPGPLIDLISGGGSQADQKKAEIYLFYSAFTLIPTVFAYAFSYSLQETKRPMISFLAALGGMATNIILDPLMIVMVQNFNWGINAAVMLLALSTGLARIVQALIVLVYILFRKEDPLYFLKQFKVDFVVYKKIFKHQITVFINEAGYGLGNLILIICLMRNNPIYHDEMTNVGLIFQFTSIVWPGIASVSAVLIGSRLGAGQIGEAKKNASILIRWGILLTSFLALILFILSFWLNDFLSPGADQSVIVRSMHLEWILIPIIISQGIFSAIYYSMRTGGSKAVLLSDLSIMLVWTMLLLPLVMTNTTRNMNPLWFLFLVEFNQIIKMLVSYVLYKKSNWAKKLTTAELKYESHSALNPVVEDASMI